MDAPTPDDPARAPISAGKFHNVDLRVARVDAAPTADGTNVPSRLLTLDLGPLGRRTSVAQLALVPESDLIGTLVVVVANLGTRSVGPYESEVLVLGVPHPDNPAGQGQATPLTVTGPAEPGQPVF